MSDIVPIELVLGPGSKMIRTPHHYEHPSGNPVYELPVTPPCTPLAIPEDTPIELIDLTNKN